MPLSSQTTLWQSQIFTGFEDVPKRIVKTSPVVSNSSYNSARLHIEFEAISPDGAVELSGYSLQALLQVEIASGVWETEAVMQRELQDSAGALTYIIDLSPGLVENPGVINWLQVAGKNAVGISREEGSPIDKVRACLVSRRTDPLKPDFASCTVSGYMVLFNT